VDKYYALVICDTIPLKQSSEIFSVMHIKFLTTYPCNPFVDVKLTDMIRVMLVHLMYCLGGWGARVAEREGRIRRLAHDYVIFVGHG